VSEISLPSNRMSGTLPREIALAGVGGQIVYLDLSGNNIGGKIVSELGTLKNLGESELIHEFLLSMKTIHMFQE